MDISKTTVRSKLAPRREPYWKRVSHGAYLGVRIGKGRNEYWVARYRDSAGKQHTRSLKAAHTYDAADRLAREWFISCGLGVVHATSVEEACRAYVDTLRALKGDKVARAQAGYLRRAIYATPFGAIDLDQLRARDVERWRDALLEAPMSRASANRYMKTLKATLNHAFRLQLVATDQAWRSVKAFENANVARAEYLTLAQRRALLRAAKGAIKDLIAGVLLVGARPIELARLHVSDFDPIGATVTLTSYKGRGSKRRDRQVPLAATALTLFKRLARGKPADGFLFVQTNGSPWPHSGWDELFRDVRDRAGLSSSITLYVCRHTAIAQWLSAGVDTQTVSKIAGTSLAMLESVYSKHIKHHAAERLAAVRMV